MVCEEVTNALRNVDTGKCRPSWGGIEGLGWRSGSMKYGDQGGPHGGGEIEA